MKKIVFFSVNLCIGGMEKALVDLLNLLAGYDYEITLVLENRTGELLRELDSGIRVEEFRLCTDRNVIVRKLKNLLHRRKWIAGNRNRYDFSCAYATYSVIGTRLALAASENSAIYIHSNYYDVYSGDREKIDAFFADLLLDKFKHLIFVSNESRDKLQTVYPFIGDKGTVINNVIDYNKIRILAQEEPDGAAEGDGAFLFVGRLEEESKRLTRLIKAFSLVHKTDEKLKLYMIGNGKDRELCRRKIREYGLDGTVIMLGEKVNPYPYIKRAGCVVMTSDYEGYPVIYNECLVLGTPMITTVPVSDGDIDIRNYACIVPKSAQAVADGILSMKQTESRENKIDFEQLNQKKIRRLIRLIEKN